MGRPKWVVRYHRGRKRKLALGDARILWPDMELDGRYFLWEFAADSKISPPVSHRDLAWGDLFTTDDLKKATQSFNRYRRNL